MIMVLKEYFSELNARERKIVIIGAIFLSFFLFYSLIYAPLATNVAAKQKILFENKQTLRWMEDVYAKHKDIKPLENLSNERLLASLSNSLSASDLKDFPYQLEQTATGDLRLSYSKVPYSNFMQWLWPFCGKYGLSIKSYMVNSKGFDGTVSANIVLSLN